MADSTPPSEDSAAQQQATPYRTTPDVTDKMPGGIPYIVGNEAAERFSFYGMRGILTIFMTEHLRSSAGGADLMSDEDAKWVYHMFLASAYFFPILGSLLADIVWGKYKTILILSLGYCVGHLCLAMGDTGIGAGLLEPRNWLYLGLIFISIGSGGIKPCVSAHVGDQFGSKNKSLISKTFSWFYFSINVGAAASNLLTPYLLEHKDFGPAYAFGLPGVLMALATFLFWAGRNRFVHIPPAGREKFIAETFEPSGLRALRNLSPLFLLFIPMFWCLFDQTGSAWVLQATRLDRTFLSLQWYEAQVQAVNPILILILIPTFAYGVYPLMGRLFEPTPLRKIGIGLFTTVLAFGISTWIESQLTGGAVVTAGSQADRDHWRAIHLIDGAPDSAWLSKPIWPQQDNENDRNKSHEIVLRLRDHQQWRIDRVVFHPLAGELEAPAPDDPIPGLDTAEEALLRSGAACRAKTIKLLVGDAPKPKDGWQEVGNFEITHGKESASFEFEPISAAYVKLIIQGNQGGAYTGLAEVQVFAQTKSSQELVASDRLNVVELGDRPTIGWQFLAYFFLTAAEVMVSIVGLEFAYTQAPKKMKSFIMGVFFLGVSLGNLFAAGVNWFIVKPDGSTILQGVAYYQFFTLAMLVIAIAYVIWSLTYRGQAYIQGEAEEVAPAVD